VSEHYSGDWTLPEPSSINKSMNIFLLVKQLYIYIYIYIFIYLFIYLFIFLWRREMP